MSVCARPRAGTVRSYTHAPVRVTLADFVGCSAEVTAAMALLLNFAVPGASGVQHAPAFRARRAALAPQQQARRPCQRRAAAVVHAAKSGGVRRCSCASTESPGPENVVPCRDARRRATPPARASLWCQMGPGTG